MRPPIDPAISRPRQPAPTTITRRRLQRRRAVPGRKPAPVSRRLDPLVDAVQLASATGKRNGE